MKINIEKAEKAIGVPALEWAGRCHEIASALVDAGVVKGKVRYGHYLGEITPGTMFANRGIVQHGWIELPDGSVVDPTRWVFEDADPYIYHTSDEDDLLEYDVGGNVFRAQNARPCPEYKDEKHFHLPSGAAGEMLGCCLPEGQPEGLISISQVFWVANLPYGFLGKYAKDVYEWIEENDLTGFIPIDNYRLVMEG